MTEHHPQTSVCDCPDLRSLATEFFEQDPPPCPIHRPSVENRQQAIALNDDAALLAAIDHAFRR